MEVILKNYRCFRDATLRLSPLTVLVGANASGKTTLARALNPRLGFSQSDAWQGRNELGAEVVHRIEGRGEAHTTLYPGRESTQSSFDGGFPDLEYQMLVLNVDYLRGANILTKATRLQSDGSNLANVFGTLTRAQQTAFSQKYCSLVPVYSDIDTVPVTQGQLTIRFQDRWNPDRWYLPSDVSDGSMFIAAFLLLAHQSPPVDILVVEDAEHGLHPFLLGEVVGILRDLAVGKLTGRPMHVVLTTHSPTVLDFSKPEELRVLDRQEDGSVNIVELPTGTEHWRKAFKVYDESLGKAWLSGGLGGTP